MEQQTLLLIGGMAMIVLGLAYLFNRAFAGKMWHARAALGGRSVLTKLLPEELGIKLIRFVLGPVLIVIGLRLILAYWSSGV